MRARSAEITTFLQEDLLASVKDAFSRYRYADNDLLQKDLEQAIKDARKHFDNPEDSKEVKRIRLKLEENVNINALENDVYDHLYSFFRRYYAHGDFLTKRVYKKGVYAVPYEGEEVLLHWANKDQYFIKTSEFLQNYTFCLEPESETNPMRVRFYLADATEGKHDNVKESEGTNRVFVLAAEKDTEHRIISEVQGKQGKELVIRFEYRPATLADWPGEQAKRAKKPPKQENLVSLAVERILATDDPKLSDWIVRLGSGYTKANGEEANYSRLESHLKRYTARNTFDYFIHKNLRGFLRRELDFYIKNELMHIDDIENESTPRVESYLVKIKVIRQTARKIIDFLAQLEDFQKKLWQKKKFVVETNYCMTLDRIPLEMYSEISTNDAQYQEWKRVFGIDEIEGASNRNAKCGAPLTIEFLKKNRALVLDTKFFDDSFKSRLLDSIDDFEERCDGILVHSESEQALNLLHRRFAQQVSYAYLDPPFNTNDVGFLYKNEYKHSSWATMISNQLNVCKKLLRKDGVVSVAIDDLEHPLLTLLCDAVFGKEGRLGTLVVNIKPSGRTNDRFFATSHEYLLFYGLDPSNTDIVFFPLSQEQKAQYSEFDNHGAYKWRDFLRTGGTSTPTERPNSFYPIFYNEATNEISLEKKSNFVEILPLDSSGRYRVWRKTPSSFQSHVNAAEIKVTRNAAGKFSVYIIDRIKQGTRPKSLWVGKQYDASSHGTKLLKQLFGNTSPFSFPKSLHAVYDCLYVVVGDRTKDCIVLDSFAGSGTTGHALINLNRRDNGRRKYILTEMGDHFNTVLHPRILKAIYSETWKNGKPTSHRSSFSHCLKYLRLESFEDTLNNLELHRSEEQQSLLEASNETGKDGFKESYFLGYILDVESRGSPSLLNVQAFSDPTSYKMKIKKPSSDESREVKVDLIETFNLLIGLTVTHIAAPQTIGASFEKNDEGRLQLTGELKHVRDGDHWFRAVRGSLPDKRDVLVLWRKHTGNQELDNLVLDNWFADQGLLDEKAGFDLIYVNGSNNLENLKRESDRWKVRLIEEDFHRLMFEMAEES